MKKQYLLLIPFLFLTEGCSQPPIIQEGISYQNNNQQNYNTYIENSCASVLNLFNKYKYKKNIVIPVQKGFEKLAKKDFIAQLNRQFTNSLDTLTSVKYPFISKKCVTLNNILKEQNYEIQSRKLHNFKKQWYQSYQQELNHNIKPKIKLKIVTECYPFAQKYFKLVVEKNPNLSVKKHQYNECLNMNLHTRSQNGSY